MFLLSEAEVQPSSNELPKWQTEWHSWHEANWHISSAFCAVPVCDSTSALVILTLVMALGRTPPIPPLLISSSPNSTDNKQWSCEKRTLFNPVCINLIYYCFIGKYVFSHANQRFSSKNMKKSVCRDTRMERNVHFTKALKKTQSHECIKESVLIIQLVFLSRPTVVNVTNM